MSPAPTPTPRSDAWLRGYDDNQCTLDAHATMQKLERELAEAKAEIAAKSEQWRMSSVCREMKEQAGRLAGALENLLILSECADETGYVDGHGFMDADAIHDTARTEITAWRSHENPA